MNMHYTATSMVTGQAALWTVVKEYPGRGTTTKVCHIGPKMLLQLCICLVA